MKNKTLPARGWRFTFGMGQPPEATVPFDHYQRMQAVIAAARTGNDLLIKLALAHFDEKLGG